MKSFILLLFQVIVHIALYNISYAQEEDFFARYSQQVEKSVMSPNSQSFTNYITFPEISSSGMMQIEIPLFTLRDRDLELDLKVNYNPNSLLVDNVASWVGTGWTLQSGGLITRQVRHIPDDVGLAVNDYWGWMINAFIQHPQLGNHYWLGGKEPEESSWANKINFFPHTGWYDHLDPLIHPEAALGWSVKFYDYFQVDLEPDIFTVNINGESFKFVFNENREPKILNGFNDYIIEYEQEADGIFDITNTIQFPQTINGRTKALNWVDVHIKSFTIISPEGYKYYFEEDDTETTVRYLRFLGVHTDVRLSEQEMPPYITAWYLSRIESPKGNELNIEYETRETIITPPIPLIVGACEDGSNCANSDEKRFKFDPRDHLAEFIERFIDGTPPFRFEKRYSNGVTIEDATYDDMLDRRTRYKLKMKFVSEIETDNIRIEFNSNNDRQDFPNTPELNEILVFDKQENGLFKKLDFFYNYEFDINGAGDIPLHWKKRLFLQNIIESDLNETQTRNFTFEYSDIKLPHLYSKAQDAWGFFNNKDYSSLIPQLYVYPNQTGINRYRLFPIASSIDNHYYLLPGSDRLVDELFITAGTLKKIIFPTGGYRMFEFESNEYWDESGQVNQKGGGLRVKSILYQDNVNPENNIERSYSYKQFNNSSRSSGNIVYPPIYANETNFYLPKGAWRPEVVMSDYGNFPSWSGSEEDEWNLFTKRSSHPLNEIKDKHGVSVYYTDIREYFVPSSGYVEYKFYNPQTIETSKPEVLESRSLGCDYCDFVIDPLFYNNNGNQPDHELFRMRRGNAGMAPFALISDLNPTIDLISSKLMSKTIYKQGESVPIEKREYNYIIHGHEEEIVYGLMKRVYDVTTANTLLYGFSQGRGWNAISRYELSTNQGAFLEKEIITEYKSNKNEFQLVSQNSFSYTPRNALYRSIETITPTFERKKVFRYPFDVTGHEPTPNEVNTELKGFWGLRDQNRISEPLQIIEYFKMNTDLSKIISGEMIFPMSSEFFPNTNNGIHIAEVFSLDLLSPINSIIDLSISDDNVNGIVYDPAFKSEVKFIDYDDRGNVLQIKSIGDFSSTYVYGYSNSLPIAKIENATYDLVESELTALGHTIEDLQDENTNLHQIFNDLRARPAMKDAMITSYTHEPLVGMTSQTDPTGWVTYYIYDSFGRLQYIRNHEGFYLKEYKYHYGADKQTDKTDLR